MKKFLILKPNIKDNDTNQYIGGKYQIVTETYLHINRSRLGNSLIYPLTEEQETHLYIDGYYKIMDGITYYYNSIDPFKLSSFDEPLTREIISDTEPEKELVKSEESSLIAKN